MEEPCGSISGIRQCFQIRAADMLRRIASASCLSSVSPRRESHPRQLSQRQPDPVRYVQPFLRSGLLKCGLLLAADANLEPFGAGLAGRRTTALYAFRFY